MDKLVTINLQTLFKIMETTKIYPIGDRVLIRIGKTETVTASGITISDTAPKERPVRGIVEAVGTQAGTVKVGDTVLFSVYGPDEIKIGEDRFYVMKEDTILAIIK